TWGKGSGPINQTNLQSLLTTLSNLRAVRWVAAAPGPQQGFDKPQLAIIFTTSQDDKSSHKLLIGSEDRNGTWFARAEGREGTFVISDPDFNALRLPLAVVPGSPTPMPAASASSLMATPNTGNFG